LVLRERDAGAETTKACCRQGLSDSALYEWKAKYGGMEASEAKRLEGPKIGTAALRQSSAYLLGVIFVILEPSSPMPPIRPF
jgi:hypothetical protein